jgi:hypothetical protein
MFRQKTLVSIMLLSALPVTVTAQGWLPVNTGEVYNYRTSGTSLICCNIRVDSTNFIAGDSVYYLNTVFKDYGSYVVRNVPVFLKREIHVSDSAYLFHSPGNYFIPKMISPGEEWIFDTTRSITAMLSGVTADTLFGLPDSLKIILLTGTGGNLPDTLIMSKHHGIVKFPDFEQPGKHFLLAGLENQGSGMQMPGMEDFYDFQVGDRFQFRNLYESFGHGSGKRIARISEYDITDVQKAAQHLIYHKKGLWKETIDYWDPGFGIDTTYDDYGLIDEDDTIVFDPSSWMNYYIGQVICFGASNKFRLFTYEMSPEFNKPVKSKDLRLFDGGWDTAYAVMPYPADPASVCAGLGRTNYYYQPYNESWRITENLTAYKKGEETYGSFDSFCELLDPEIKAGMCLPEDTTLYILHHLELTMPDQLDSYRWSNGSESNSTVIYGTDYGPGTHYIWVETGYFNCVHCDTIRITVTEDPSFINPDHHSPVAIEYCQDQMITIKNVSTAALDYSLLLLDGSGRPVLEKNYYGHMPGSDRCLSTRDLASGVYIIVVKNEGINYTRKIIR